MEFIEHTMAWCKGEIAEGKIIFVFGVIVLIGTYIFSKFRDTINMNEFFWALSIVGFVYLIIGVTLYSNNHKRIIEYSAEYQKTNERTFALKEKDRVEEFIAWYPVTRIFLFTLILIGIFMYFSSTDTINLIGMILVFFAFSGFVIDYFSEARAKTYHIHILKILE